ncbi:MAG: ABC transporter permease [Alistipes sp.]|jgi:lipoprotein-releasing system permease protein|nr:ABC transporter permease [Alistipes sp.]
MRVSYLIARRFLFSPKSHSVINIISRVSMVAVGIPVAAMVILMGVFSGFDDLIRKMYHDFDPDLTVQPAEGKVFDPARLDRAAIERLEGVDASSLMLEESAMIEYRGRQVTAKVRGVDSLFPRVVPIERMMWAGSWNGSGVVPGQGIAYDMGVSMNLTEPMRFIVPRRGAWSSLLPMTVAGSIEVPVGGVFVLDAETDGEYVLMPIERARELFEYAGMASNLAIRFVPGAHEKRVKDAVQAVAGDGFRVLTRYERNEVMYRIMRLEKWGIFAIGLAVLIIASFSIVGSLIMLIIDKRDGTATLRALGARASTVRGIFVRQGMMIGTIGASGGLTLGLAVCTVQQLFGVIPMPGATFLVENYPVLVRWGDIGAIVAAFVAVCWIITIFTVRMTVRSE